MAVIAIAGDHLVALLDRHLHPDDHRFLADIEMAESADETHAVELAGFLLEAADQQHLAKGHEFLFLAEFRRRFGCLGSFLTRVFGMRRGVGAILFGFWGRH